MLVDVGVRYQTCDHDQIENIELKSRSSASTSISKYIIIIGFKKHVQNT